MRNFTPLCPQSKCGEQPQTALKTSRKSLGRQFQRHQRVSLFAPWCHAGVGTYTAGKLHLLSATHTNTQRERESWFSVYHKVCDQGHYSRRVTTPTGQTVNRCATTLQFEQSVPFISSSSTVTCYWHCIDSLTACVKLYYVWSVGEGGALCTWCGVTTDQHENLLKISKEIISYCDLLYRRVNIKLTKHHTLLLGTLWRRHFQFPCTNRKTNSIKCWQKQRL